MNVELTASIPADGCVDLAWRPDCPALSASILVIRTGPVPAFTALRLAGDLASYRIQNLSRHQRYRIAVLCASAAGTAQSRWFDVTPRAGLDVVAGDDPAGAELTAHVARIGRVMVMPQDRRLTLYWTMTRGFADRVVLEISKDRRPWHRLEVEPEVASLALEPARGIPLENGTTYEVRVAVSFAGLTCGAAEPIAVTPAPSGEERRANQPHPQEHFLYPRLCVSPELKLFPDDGAELDGDAPPARIVCCHCRRDVSWTADRLLCSGCRAEFIPNGRGDFLDVTRLRFGTCRCCVPHKILVRSGAADTLACAHSGKEHIRVAGAGRGAALQLIEDLRYGLCQCCRPRRPLVLRGSAVVCSKSRETHRNEQGQYVLVPSQPVFDAAAIDDLLDSGFAEICSTGITADRRNAARR